MIEKKDFIGYFFLGLIYGGLFSFFDEFGLKSLLPLVSRSSLIIFLVTVLFLLLPRKKLPFLFELFVKQTFITALLYFSSMIIIILYLYYVHELLFMDVIRNQVVFDNINIYESFVIVVLFQFVPIIVLWYHLVKKVYR